MRRFRYVYLSVFLIMAKRWGKRCLNHVGERMKRWGRVLVTLAEDNVPRWNIELLRECYLADAEFHTESGVFRGPMYGAFIDGKILVFRLNWVVLGRRSDQDGYGGTFDFICRRPSPPDRLPNGDVWFMFEGGYAVLFLGEPRKRIFFLGAQETPRVYAYF